MSYDENSIRSIIHRAGKRDRGFLDEHQSMIVLEAAGIRCAARIVAESAQSAAEAARKLGYPIVLKGIARGLAHKSEAGAVITAIPDEPALLQAAEKIRRSLGNSFEGLLVAEMIEGRREFIAGYFFDKTFGPAVMFGLGGTAAEAIDDVAFRLAPINIAEAGTLIDEIKTQRLLGAFRGEPAVDRNGLSEILVGLARLGSSEPGIAAIDINPLIINGSKPVAVDALIVLNKDEENEH